MFYKDEILSGFCWVKTQPTVLIICDFNKILSKQILRLSAQNDVVNIESLI